MTSLAISAAPVNNNDNNMNNKKLLNSNRRNKTYKNIKNNHNKSMEIMQAMARSAYSEPDGDVDDDTDLENFTPIQPSFSTSGQKHIQNLEQTLNNQTENGDSFSKLPGSYSPENYKQYIPDYSQENNNINHISNSELLKKLDNILHLLEEQSEEKTNYIIEELILYVFLGIFIIFVLDSFVRAGKYVR